MTLSASTLGDELKAMGLYDNESDAIDAWAAAYRAYFEDATSNSVTIVPASLIASESAMAVGMVGLKTTGALSIQAGIAAFWAAIIPSVAWPTVTAIAPPVLLTGISAALTTVFTANKEGELSKDESMDAIAASIHINSAGGLATWPGPSTFPIL